MLAAVLLPQREAGAAEPSAHARSYGYGGSFEEGGSCGDTEEATSVFVDCGAQQALTFDEPMLVSLMRKLGFEMDKRECEDLLRDIYAELSCEGRGPDCGQLGRGMPPGPAPKLAAGSSSAQSSMLAPGVCPDSSCGMLAERARPLSSRERQPPVPPPR